MLRVQNAQHYPVVADDEHFYSEFIRDPACEWRAAGHQPR